MYRVDVLYMKSKVKNSLQGAAVFTQKACSLSHTGIKVFMP